MIENIKINYEIDGERLKECGLGKSQYAISVSYKVNGISGNCFIFKMNSGKLKITYPTFSERKRFKDIGVKRKEFTKELLNHPKLRLKLLFVGVN